MMADRNAANHRPRLLILDMRFPVSVWCLDSSDMTAGTLNIEANADLQQNGEAAELAAHINAILRICDVDLLATEETAKSVVQEASKD